ncbi:MAG: hypothetical protein UU22_C0049G0001, partial [Parcubacteria group bacterium GW2011_GWA2_40_8]
GTEAVTEKSSHIKLASTVHSPLEFSIFLAPIDRIEAITIFLRYLMEYLSKNY